MEPADDTGVAGLADRLWRAQRRTALHPSDHRERPDLTMADAYAIQSHNVTRRSRRAGWHEAASSG